MIHSGTGDNFQPMMGAQVPLAKLTQLTSTSTSTGSVLNGSLDEFETLSLDMKRLVQVWLQNTQSSFKAAVADLEDALKRFAVA